VAGSALLLGGSSDSPCDAVAEGSDSAQQDGDSLPEGGASPSGGHHFAWRAAESGSPTRWYALPTSRSRSLWDTRLRGERNGSREGREARITRSAWRSRSTPPDAAHRQRVVVLQLDASVTAEKRLALRPDSIARVSSLFYDGRRLEADRWTLVCGNRERLLSIL